MDTTENAGNALSNEEMFEELLNSIDPLQPRLFKGAGHPPGNEVDEFFHLEHPFPL